MKELSNNEKCKNCVRIRRVKYLKEAEWKWFSICSLFLDEPDGWGIVVTEDDFCECFDEVKE